MSDIFGFTLLKNNRMSKESIITLTALLIKSQFGPIEEINLAVATDSAIHIIRTDMSVNNFTVSKEFFNFFENVTKDQKIFSLIGSFKNTKNAEEYNTSEERALAVYGEAVCVQKECEFTDVQFGGDVVAEVLDRYEYAADITSRIKTAAKDVRLYAGIHAAYPSTLLLAKHTADPLRICMFATYGVLIFSSIITSIDKVTTQLLLGKKEDVDIFSHQAFLLCMDSNKYKVVNSYPGNVNYAIK